MISMSSCEVPNGKKLAGFDSYCEKIENRFENITKITTSNNPNTIRIDIYLKNGEMEEILKIFKLTKEYILQKDVQESILKEFTHKEIGVPVISLSFDINGDSNYDYEVRASYYEKPYSNKFKNKISGYKKWDISSYKQEKGYPKQIN